MKQYLYQNISYIHYHILYIHYLSLYHSIHLGISKGNKYHSNCSILFQSHFGKIGSLLNYLYMSCMIHGISGTYKLQIIQTNQ